MPRDLHNEDTLPISDTSQNPGIQLSQPYPRDHGFPDTRMGPVLSVVRAHTTFHTYPYLYEVLPQYPREHA